MPSYSNTLPPISISTGDSTQVWIAGDGNLASGTKTQRAGIANSSVRYGGRLSARISFGGAPGVISLQLQTSDTDVDTDYVSEGAPITAVNGSNVARQEYSNVAAKFARLLATTVTNAVTATVELAG